MRVAALLAGALAAGSASTAPAPEFTAEVAKPRWVELRHSYRAGCPVGPAQLRTVRLSYWSFDGRARIGRLVVNERVARDVVAVFRRLYAARFPIRRMVPVSRYHGSDDASMAADNTSGFNCRFVSGTSRWSMHAYGLAIDVNPVENPYVAGARVSPPAGRRYLDRGRRRPGMAAEGGVLVQAFAAAGWEWGGHWRASADYQHFSTNGR
jgi:D-alanyl-D-alanine carboxypeptidase